MKAKKIIFSAIILSVLLMLLNGCGSPKKANKANLDLDIGVGIIHFDDDSDYPLPSENAYLDVYSSKIVIVGAYDNKIIETPLIYNNSATAYPRMQLSYGGNRIYVVYCPDISIPTLQIASTNDGGETWIQSTLALDATEVGTIDNFTSSFWSTRSGALIIANGMVNTYIYLTNDSGKSWARTAGAPPEQNWHDSLYGGAFLNEKIGFVSYSYYSFPPNEPQIYITLDGGTSWQNLSVKVPASVMTSYSLAGTPFYDGTKINIPIELYSSEGELANSIYYVSYDLGENWEYFVENAQELESIRYNSMLDWIGKNQNTQFSDFEYKVSDFAKYSSFELEDNVRIETYKLVTAYKIDDWSKINLTKDMYFDEDMWLYNESPSGWPILIYVYEGDVFNYNYSLFGFCYEQQYKNEGEAHLSKRLLEEYRQYSELKNLFSRACEAYSWFTGYTLNIVGEEKIEHLGVTYDSVVFKAGNTLGELRNYLLGIFSQEITEKLMNTKVDSLSPLFIEKNGKLYRYSGYVGASSYTSVESSLEISESVGSSYTVTVSGEEEIDGKNIAFSYDCIFSRLEDGSVRAESFKLPIEHLYSSANTEKDNNDKTETSITDISDWAELNYSSYGSSQIYEYLKALIHGNTERLASLDYASDASAFGKYASIVISSYTISKKHIGDQPIILFEYEIKENFGASVPRTEAGKHSAYVKICDAGVYMTDVMSPEKSGVEKLISDYFECTMEYMPLDFGDLNYQQNYNITQFILKRLGGQASDGAIKNYANKYFNITAFNPSPALLEGEMYRYTPAGTRTIMYDVISEDVSLHETVIQIRLYADMSKFIPARTVKYVLKLVDGEYLIENVTLIESSTYKVCKYSEQ